MMNRNDGSEGVREGEKKTYRNTRFSALSRSLGFEHIWLYCMFVFSWLLSFFFFFVFISWFLRQFPRLIRNLAPPDSP